MKKKGFTLIEIFIVIVIIGFLVTIITMTYGSSRGKARDSKRKEHLLALKRAIESIEVEKATIPQFYDDTNTCANSRSDKTGWDGTITGCTDTPLIPRTYLTSMPVDPLQGLGTKTYIYQRSDTLVEANGTRNFRYGYRASNGAWKLSSLMETDYRAIIDDGGTDPTATGTAPPSTQSQSTYEIFGVNGAPLNAYAY